MRRWYGALMPLAFRFFFAFSSSSFPPLLLRALCGKSRCAPCWLCLPLRGVVADIAAFFASSIWCHWWYITIPWWYFPFFALPLIMPSLLIFCFRLREGNEASAQRAERRLLMRYCHWCFVAMRYAMLRWWVLSYHYCHYDIAWWRYLFRLRCLLCFFLPSRSDERWRWRCSPSRAFSASSLLSCDICARERRRRLFFFACKAYVLEQEQWNVNNNNWMGKDN